VGDNAYDIVVAGGGPAGLSAAEAAAAAGVGARVLVVEQNPEIGSPIRTSGGSFIADLEELGIPSHLYQPFRRCRFIAPSHQAAFEHDPPIACGLDVRGLYQFLAERAIAAGAHLRLATTVTGALRDDGRVCGVVVRTAGHAEQHIPARVVIDATGYRAAVVRHAGVTPGFSRFGVGAEYDLYAPHHDSSEAVLIVGTAVAPSGYAWFLPWKPGRVRAGVGIIHPDSADAPERYLDTLVAGAHRFGVDLRGAQPVESHHGLIPSEGLVTSYAGDGILACGDSAGQSSTLVGEGIRWVIRAGRIAGDVAADAVRRGDVSRARLGRAVSLWKRDHGRNLRLAYLVNQRISRWTDPQWDRGVALLAKLSPEHFARFLATDFSPGWIAQALLRSPELRKTALRRLISRQPA
jgi:digeranylgeranylglycerophospholipid reductase